MYLKIAIPSGIFGSGRVHLQCTQATPQQYALVRYIPLTTELLQKILHILGVILMSVGPPADLFADGNVVWTPAHSKHDNRNPRSRLLG